MSTTIQISTDLYNLLKQRARESQMTPDKLAETVIRLQFGNTTHIEQRTTPFGTQAYLRGTRVAVRHVAAFLKAGHSTEEIMRTDLPHLPPAALYEAIAYFYDHTDEIEAELQADTEEAVMEQLKSLLLSSQLQQLLGQG